MSARLFPQGRHVDSDHVLAAIEVPAEGALGKLPRQLSLRRGDDPYIDRDCLPAAQVLDFSPAEA
jgi:hypothetical protein